MNNYYLMSAPAEAKNRTEASMITAGFAALMVLIMFLLKWKTPVFEIPVPDTGIEVELNLPEEPQQLADGGGGGGNPVKAAGAPGIANYSPPAPGVNEPSKAVEETDDKEAVLPKTAVTKPAATKIVNTSVTKPEPKPVVETPAPKVPKAVAGKNIIGNNKGGNNADNYDQSGGKGNGNGVGNGNGTGGGTGNGTGGGNGTGSGSGTGPKITRGDRKIIRHYSFEGDLDKAVIYANVSVSPEGIGKFVSISKGSSNSSNAYKEAIIRYLQNIKFDKADHESMLTVQFNFRVN